MAPPRRNRDRRRALPARDNDGVVRGAHRPAERLTAPLLEVVKEGPLDVSTGLLAFIASRPRGWQAERVAVAQAGEVPLQGALDEPAVLLALAQAQSPSGW